MIRVHKTSGMKLFRMPRAASTTRLTICGDTFEEKATPRTRFTIPELHSRAFSFAFSFSFSFSFAFVCVCGRVRSHKAVSSLVVLLQLIT